MAIRLVPHDDECDHCGGKNDCMLLLAHGPGKDIVGMVLCAECRIRAEAALRGSRKNGGTVVRNWTPKGEQS